MKTYKPSQLLILGLLAVFPLSISTVHAADKATGQKPALSDNDVDHISERIRQTGEQMRADLKKARERFEAQVVERKQAAERARLQAIKDNEQRQAQKAAQARQQQLAVKAQADRERQEAEQARLQAERKKQMVLAAQSSKESQATDLQARKARAAEALKKMRASTEPKAF
ncbi:MAG: hypothetical protein ACYC4K_03320 [Thiobacillus sp.]